jgi:hypothetical protein
VTEVGDAQVEAELAHWRGAIAALADLDAFAAPAAWAMLEEYLRLQLRERLLATIRGLSREGASVAALLDSGASPEAVRPRILLLRWKYLQVESIIDFYGDAVNTRTTPVLGAILGGLDTIAVDSMEVLLRPLGHDVPPALVWLDKGSGAAILRAGVRLWGPGGVSPVAAIKLTRHNLGHPTAILHETGHQVAHLTGWTQELAFALDEALQQRSTELAELWRGWSSEIAADVHAFVLAGWAPVPALANVVDGPTTAVHRIRPGDPHPPALIRVLFNVALCRRWYGIGPWESLADTWLRRHDPSTQASSGARVAAASLPLLPVLAAVCTERPFAAFGHRPIHALADPRRVSPEALDALVRRAGPSLLTSRYLSRRESLRILAVLGSQRPADPNAAAAARARLHEWLATLASVPLPRAA